MKQSILFLAVIAMSCKKSSTVATNPVNTNNPTTTRNVYYDPIYWDNDTLYGYGTSGAPDTVISLKSGGKCYIIHKGIQYAIKAYVTTGNTFSDSTGNYLIDVLDMSGNFITAKDSIGESSIITTKRFDKSYNNWVKQQQSFYPPHKSPFPQNITAYLSKK